MTPTTPPPDNGAGKLKAIKQVYEVFDYTACRPNVNCASTFAMRVGFDLGPGGNSNVPNPRATLENPDPVWIPEWKSLPTGDAGAHYAFEAVTLAAVHKSFRAACEKAYAKYDKELSARMEALSRAIAEKNRDPNPYDRLSGLLALQPPRPDKSRLHEFAEGADAVRWQWETSVFDAFEDTKRTFVYMFDAYAPSDELLAVIHPRQPKDYEVDAFCVAAAQGKIGGVAPLPDTSTWDAGIRAMVKRYVPDDRVLALEKRRADLADVSKAKFAKVKIPNPQLPPGIRELSIAKASTFERDGKKAIVTMVVNKENKVGSRVIKIDETATATFDDWPSGVILEPGDSMSFYGAETTVKEMTLKSTPELEHKSRTYILEGKHITKISTKSKTFVYFK